MLVQPPRQVWLADFPFLRIRPSRSHPECAVCVKMKLWIRHLGDHLHARRQQLAAYHSHLHHQYRDRLCYWEQRGVSRAHDGKTILAIVDGMDQAKFAYPRHLGLKSRLVIMTGLFVLLLFPDSFHIVFVCCLTAAHF